MISRTMSISERVLQALMVDDRTREAVIDVSGTGGTVTLAGMVPSHEVRQAAEEIARQQNGVIFVINELQVS